MTTFNWFKCCLSLVTAAAFAGSASLQAQEKASPAGKPSGSVVNPGLPGQASAAPAVTASVKYSPSDPKMALATSPAVSMVERAETLGLQAASKAADILAPWSTEPVAERTVFGKDDRTKVGNTAAFPYSTICSLEMTFPNGSVRIGSGCFISYQSVLTAGHCVYDKSLGGWARSIKVMPGRNGSSLPFGYGYGSSFTSVTGWTVNGDRAYDYGAIKMGSSTLGNKVGYMGYANQTDSFLKNQANVFNTAGFPGDKGGTTMYFTSGQISSVNSNNLYYYFDIMGGQSGSPIWYLQNGNRYVIGIVTAEYKDGSGRPNIGSRINTSLYNFIKALPK